MALKTFDEILVENAGYYLEVFGIAGITVPASWTGKYR